MVKNVPANAGDTRNSDSIPGLGKSPEGGHGNPHQYSWLENPMDRGAWQSIGLQSQTRLKQLSTHACLCALRNHRRTFIRRYITSDTSNPETRSSPALMCLRSTCVHLSHLCPTLWTVAHQAPLSMGFSSQDYWSGLFCPPPEDLSNPRTESRSPELQEYSLLTEPLGKP